jgi:hypothetical protein
MDDTCALHQQQSYQNKSAFYPITWFAEGTVPFLICLVQFNLNTYIAHFTTILIVLVSVTLVPQKEMRSEMV